MPDQPPLPASDVNSTPLPTSCGRALVLGGGSLKGAFQCGAIMAILESGYQPEALYGISVGSLNATFLTYEANRQHAENGHIDWPKAGRALLEFWIRNITRPEAVAVLKSRFLTGYNTLMSRFDGFLDNAPLRHLINSYVDVAVLKQGPIKLKVGAVNVIEGDMVYVDPGDDHFLDYVFASSSLPFLMPAVPIGGDHRKAFLDGGLREVAPLREAISDGATAIMCVACHAKHIFNESFNYRNLLNLVERVKDITVNQIVNNDIAWAERFVERETSRGHPFELTVIRPTEPLYLNLQKFNSNDISKLIVQGYKAGTDVLKRSDKV
ncbi:patatin-like phospholipase family protein [Fibrella sp. HMF5335]|uniref:Patatin-like phospholipase family protein n=1 Tax=Fibrella rubiginis TaxID=2817060 RepID=A0A939K8M6_9BACT|nr:patatin-like phospholipase family protein [Fibrella rubiginis]MBO0939895.1 patatin-like phospholipase family protein [Fibrella rubiginis]